MLQLEKTLAELKKHITPIDILIVVVLGVAFLATRLINLNHFPIFSDEAIYIQWAKIAKVDASWRFISLTDGKQPLQTWGTIPFLKFFPNDALLAGRLFAVTMGLIGLAGVFSTCAYLFGKKAAYWGSVLFIFTPYFLFYDRLALVDSGVNAGFIWILLLSIILARTRKLDIALIFGLVGGISMLAKSSVRIFIGLSALAPVLFLEQKMKRISNLFNFYVLYMIAGILALVIYNVQRLSPFFHFVAEKNTTFIVTPHEFLTDPFHYFLSNVINVGLYSFWESGFVLPVLGLIGLYFLYKHNRQLAIYLFLWLVIPYIVVSFVSKVLYPRYIIFFASLYVILAAYYFSHIKNKTVMAISVMLFILSVSYFNYTIISDYKNIPLPPVDRGQYIEGWPSGWGINEIMTFARTQTQDKKVILLAEGNFGMAGDVLNAMLKPSDNITVKGYWPLEEAALRENQKELKDAHVYIVFPHRTEFPAPWPIKKIMEYSKPGNQSKLYLYELLPQ